MPPLRPFSLLRRCPRCFLAKAPSSRRSVSTQTSQTSSDSDPDCVYARLPTRRLISLHGPNAHHFLQGLVTSNVSRQNIPEIPSGLYSAFLNAQGRVLYDVFIYPATHSREYRDAMQYGWQKIPGLLIEVDASEVENLAKHLKRFKLKADVGIEVLEEDEWDVWSVWPNADSSIWHIDEIWCDDDRAPGMGYRVIRPRKHALSADNEVTKERYDLNRMMIGVAEGPTEIMKETALPLESNMDYMGGIDFRKGCYVGQELTIRTHHTGVVRKRILPVQLYREGTPPNEMRYDPNAKLVIPPRGANISKADKKGRSVGKWLGGVGNVGLALCRLEAMTNTVLTSESSQWSPEQEFRVAWEPEDGKPGGDVGIKAFVPDWHGEKAEAIGVHGR